jgi:aminoglycoside adenylyltransferase-like protein
VAAIRHRRSPLTGTCNGVFIRASDLPAPVSEIIPVASHVGHQFQTGAVGSDVSQVAWKVLAERGVPIRGPDPASLPLDPQPELLRSWNMGNLESYWRPWASAVERSPQARFGARPRYWTAWGVLGAPRLHHTIGTGEVVSKETAGEYALDVFPQRWHLLVADALAYWRSQPDRLGLSPRERGRLTSEFVFEVIDGVRNLGPAVP